MDTKLKTHLTGFHTVFNFDFFIHGSVLESHVGVNPIFEIYKPDVLVMYFCKIIDKFGDLKNFDIGEEIKM